MGLRSVEATNACFIRRVRASSAAFFWAAFRALAFCAALLFTGGFFFLVAEDEAFLGVVCANDSNDVVPKDATRTRDKTDHHRMRDTGIYYCGKSLPSVEGSLSAKILITSALKYPALAAAVAPYRLS